MDIEYWDSGSKGGMSAMIREWTKIDTGPFNIKITQPREEISKYSKYLWTFTKRHHSYVRALRSIIKVNGKYIFLDSTDQVALAAESWKIPFDLIVKFQHESNIYKSIAPVVPFIYTMSYYNMKLIDKCWKKRQEVLRTKQFTSSMFFAGKMNTNPNLRRRLRKYLQGMQHAKHKKMSYSSYLLELATTQAGIAAAGFGDFTHRDIELMSVGNAFFRKTFQNITRNPRIPNVHYYSIGGHEVGISKTMKHFCNYFEPNGEYRNFTDEEWNKHREISYNAREWWEKNASPQGSFNIFREILEENNII